MGEEGIPSFALNASIEAKLQQLLHYITSTEIKLCADATKEFVKLLKGSRGGELLRFYLRTSPKCPELLDAWKLRQGKPGVSYILSLIAALLSHPDGRYVQGDRTRIAHCRALDNLARLVVEEKLEDVYKELNSKEAKRQKAALQLVSAAVRRSSDLASEVAKKFDFALPAFRKLGEYSKKKKVDDKRKHSMRKPFVGFAMSFLEVGRPGLLRWILQQREMYSGVLRGLGDDDDQTLTFVLSTLRDRVLTEGSLVPPGLRSVLFGSATLEQLVGISGRENGGLASELAHSILVMVCTHPSNGLMPDFKRSRNQLRGNPKRLLDLMKKLKASEIGYHRDLLLAIVRGKLSFGAAYMEEFPYNIEDHASPNWFSVVSLAANVVSAVGADCPFSFLDSTSHDPPPSEGTDVQNVIRSVCPRPFTRSITNKGLLHSDVFVKHATLRLLLEELRLLDSFIGSLDLKSRNMPSWESFKRDIQNEVRTLLPDPQVLLSLLSSLSSNLKSHGSHIKREADSECPDSQVQSGRPVKKRKVGNSEEDADIIIGGVASGIDISFPDDNGQAADLGGEIDDGKNLVNLYADIWGSDPHLRPVSITTDAEVYFCTKLLEALQIYFRVIPSTLEGSVDFFMNLLSSFPTLPLNLLSSVLCLLAEYIRWSPGSATPLRIPPLMYKHLPTLINLSLFSPLSSIRAQAYRLSVAAMLGTGAFDRSPREVDAWFLFLPDYKGSEVQGAEGIQEFSSAVISFFCDAVSTTGNNLFKFWDIVKCNASKLQESKDDAVYFSPLAICILQKCLRVIKSESGSFPLSEKTMISLYVSSTLKYLLQTQVDASLLSSAIVSLMSDAIGNPSCEGEGDGSGDLLCEWRPLKSLLLFARSTLNHQTHCYFATDEEDLPSDGSFSNIPSQAEELLRRSSSAEISGIIRAFSSSLICTSPALILESFPSIITLLKNLHEVPVLILSPMFFVNGSLLARLSQFWPLLFSSASEMAASRVGCKGRKDDAVEKYGDGDQDELISAAFSSFLEEMPFHVLFPAIMSFNGHLLLEFSGIETLLLDKLSESTVECLVSYLRLVLFWLHQMQLSHCLLPSAEAKRLSESCVGFLKRVLAQLFASERFLQSPQLMQEMADGFFYHPAVAFLCSPSHFSKRLTKEHKVETLEAFSSLSEQSAEDIDFHVLGIVKTAFDHLWSLISSENPVTETTRGLQHFAKAFNSLVQRLLVELQNGVEFCTDMKNAMILLPVYRALLALVPLISPFQILTLVRWIFGRMSADDITTSETYGKTLLYIGCRLASSAYETLDFYLQKPTTKQAQFDMFWKAGEQDVDSKIIGEIYSEVLKQACHSEADFADLCLLKAISAVYRQKSARHLDLHPISFVLSRAVADTPIEMLSHCINRISVARAKILFLIVELSPFHLSLFGHMFSSILLTGGDVPLSNEDLLMLLPTALSFLKSTVPRYGKLCYSRFRNIPQAYFKILCDGFSEWKSFISGHLFQEEYVEFLPSSMEQLLIFAEDSFLGRAVHMLRYHFLLNGESLKQKTRLKLFNLIVPDSANYDNLLDCDIRELSSYSTRELLTVINRVIAKISLCKMLLFPECETSEEVKSDGLISSRTRLVHLLVYTWQQILKKFSLASEISATKEGTEVSSFHRYLEAFILRRIHMLIKTMRDDLIQLESIPFLEELIRSSLLYRFEDAKTLKTLRSILTVLKDGKFSCFPYLQLLLSHSQFPGTLHSISSASVNLHLGAFLRPMSSILRSLIIPVTNQSVLDNENDKEKSDDCIKKLEVLRLLKTLLHLTASEGSSPSAKEDRVNSQELLMLLLSSYGATLSEIDQEIYSVMQEIESSYDSSADFAETDFLWGSSASKIRKERALEQNVLPDVANDAGAVEQRRRSQVRENLPIDPKLCATTVLYFPYDRVAATGPLTLKTTDRNEINDISEVHRLGAERFRRYDPVFIMRFSLHMLSIGFVEPVEFASLGLLGIAFACLSSPDDGMRKLAYETLARFKHALENCQKRKDVICLRLLLNYVQNGIQEPWQRLPSVVTLFAAEASLVLLDRSHEHYAALNKLVAGSSKINMKCVPLFPNFLWSTAVNFKSERLWILRLIYAGLNADDDAPIFIRNSILENLLSFYSSPVSDNESKELILQIVKKSVKLPKLARYLVEHCGLFSWLSSVLSSTINNLSGEDKSFYCKQLLMVLEVTKDLTLSRNTTEWLQKYALEQLSELSSHLLKLLHGELKLMSEGSLVVDLILQIMTSTLKISQKRKMYQPHFTISIEGLYHIYEVVSTYDSIGSRLTSEYGLRVMLMSTPPPIFSIEQEKLPGFVTWAISVSLKSDNKQLLPSRFSDSHLDFFPEEETSEEPLTSKLLRWIAASVIQWLLSWRSLSTENVTSTGSRSQTLQQLLEYVEGSRRRGSNGSSPGFEDLLIDAMLYLQQLLGTDCRVLPSVTSALCLLLPNLFENTGAGSESVLHGISGSSLLSRIRCPPEANPSWRWSFYQPWKNLTSEQTNLEGIDEYHACQTLLVAVSNFRGSKLPGSHVLSPLDVEKSGVFEWERSLITEQQNDEHVQS